jgi:predicted porin
MQKKLIALAIASAMTVPALAYAEVNISGQANMSIDMVSNGYVVNSQTNNQLNSNQSRLVLKGSDDLGDGLSAMYQLDARFTMDDGAGFGLGGNNFIGLKSGSMGTLMVGKIDSPFKTASRKLDLFYDVAGDFRVGLGGLMSPHDLRLNNAIAYASPNMSGFAVSAASVFGAETANGTANNKKGQALSLAGTFTMDNIYAMAAYQSAKMGDNATGDLGANTFGTTIKLGGGTLAVDDELKSFRVGGSYTMDAFTVNALIEMPSYKQALSGDETKNTIFYIGGKFAISGTDNVRLAYTMAGETETGSVKNGDKANQIAIGYDHSMSKATSVYATYVKTTADPNYNYTQFTSGYTVAADGADPSVISFGMKHAF